MIKRFQNKVSESRFLLAAVGLLTIAAWIMSGALEIGSILPFVITIFSAYVIAELDTRNALLRTYSRMIPCVFLVLNTMTGLFLMQGHVFCTALWALTLFYLFSTYQNKDSASRIFIAFACLGISSLIFNKMLFYIPILWIIMYAKMRSMNMRTFTASVLGVLLPFWFLTGYYLFIGRIEEMASYFEGIFTLYDINYLDISIHDIATCSILLLLSVTGTIHFIRNSSKDKIRTRMLFESVIIINVITLIAMLLQPAIAQMLLPAAIISTSILISHFIVLTSTRITNLAFILIIFIIAAATTFNLWMHL